jgi:iron complex outermembrane receptor protein
MPSTDSLPPRGFGSPAQASCCRLAEAFTNGQWLPREDIGAQLRSFWRECPGGVNRLRASASYDLRRTLSFVISADNLLDHQLGEPDNVTVLPGRTITGGVRAKF